MRFGRWRFLWVFCSIAFFGLLGCSTNPNDAGKGALPPFHGQEVKLVAPSSLNLPALWEVLVQEWSSQSGATAQFKSFDHMAAEIDTSVTSANADGSVVLFPLNRICEIEKSFRPLISKDGQFDARDLFKGLRERVLSREHQMVACPISVPVLTCYYRSDLLRAANRVPPETWDDYYELVSSIDNWAPGLVAVEPLSPDFRATTFFARSLAFSKHPENYSVWFDVDTGKPTLNSAGFEKALEIAHRTWSKLPPETVGYGPADCRQLVLAGKSALTLTFESSEAEISAMMAGNDVKNGQRIDGIKIGICRLPGSRNVYNRNSKKWDVMPAKSVHAPAICGFAGLVAGVILPTKNVDNSAAINLLATLSSSSEFDRAFASLPKSLCRESQLAQAQSWYGPDLSSEEAGLYCDAVAQSLRDSQVVFELPLLGSKDFRQAAAAALEPLLRGEMNSSQALNLMQQKFEAIVEQMGAESVRDSYRRGLGLSPIFKK